MSRSRRRRVLPATALAMAVAASPLHAQSTITSDRPGLGSGSAVVDPGILQFELGGEFADDDVTHRISLGQGLVRYGVSDGLELQGILGSFTVLPDDEVDARGLQDVGLGAKVRLPAPGDAWSWSLLGTVTFPTGDDALTADAVVPAAVLLADVGLGPGFGVTLNVGSSGWASDAGDQLSVIVTPSLALGSSAAALYAGYAGYYARGDADLHYAEAGLTWLRDPNLQLDLNGGVEVESGGFFVGLGVAKRWPTP